jgi:hypothetical protein
MRLALKVFHTLDCSIVQDLGQADRCKAGRLPALIVRG